MTQTKTKTLEQQKDLEFHMCRVHINQHRWSRINQPNFHGWHATLLTWAGNARRRYAALLTKKPIVQGGLF